MEFNQNFFTRCPKNAACVVEKYPKVLWNDDKVVDALILLHSCKCHDYKSQIFDREIALSARGPTSGSYCCCCCCCCVVRTFVLIELYDAILLRISKSDSESEY